MDSDQRFAIDAFRAGLTAEYEEWLRLHELKLGSADEHLGDESLTRAQRQWLAWFCHRWEDMENTEREAKLGQRIVNPSPFTSMNTPREHGWKLRRPK